VDVVCRILLAVPDGSWAFPATDVEKLFPGKLADLFHMPELLDDPVRLRVFLYNWTMCKKVVEGAIWSLG
jgi:hypothetical protein